MKLSSKPISSPARTEKFPPPLMRFLRSNAGNRSRGRSKSSPMFLRKKNTAIETQEPSSPKVTCMGQVRVRRYSKQSTAKRGRAAEGDGAPTKPQRRCPCRCWWIPNALFCHYVSAKNKPNNSGHHCRLIWPDWGFFRVGSCRREPTKFREDSTKTELNFRGRSCDVSEHQNGNVSEFEERVDVNAFVSSNSSTPPRNALLLTRCRSAPYRSSSLASRSWGSPLRSEETEEGQSAGQENRESTEKSKPSSQRESLSEQEGVKDPKTEQMLRFFKELENSIRDRIMESEKVRELERSEGREVDSAARPIVLTRCKSEPARTAQKILDPEVTDLWRRRRRSLGCD